MFLLDHVAKSYGTSLVLHDISCQIPTDGFTFIMGPSGSGKSTLLRLLSFVETPDRGSVQLTLHGRQFTSDAPERPWPHLTCVYQRQFLWPHLTLRQNIMLPLRLHRNPSFEQRLRDVIALFDMSSFIDRFPNEVSGGEAQRAALARAFVLEPQLILIDEAHGGLDLEQQKVLNDYLLRLRDSGVALIVVTHSLTFASQYADTVIVVENGTITEVGARTIFKSPSSAFLRRVVGKD